MALRPERASSFLASPGTSARRCEYHVFLSFRGEDTRKGFVSHLYKALEGPGFSIFMDDQEFEGGEPISRELSSAIEDSYFSIVVLSPNYASSSWCLDELSKIVQCMGPKDSILPIFYYVDPSDVRHQRGSFAKAFEEHERKFISTQGREKVKQWKADLTKVAGLCGRHLDGTKSESEIIEEIVNCVRRKVQTTLQVCSPDWFIERDSAVNQLTERLDMGANDVRFIWITGMGGIGKTTLAHKVCDLYSHCFNVQCFLNNVREFSAKVEGNDLLKNRLLSSISKEKNVQFWDARSKVYSISHVFRKKKVLLVLDDVDDIEQLQKLAGSVDWFGNGSRIIITTRNREPLVKHDRTFLYEVEGMNDGEALALICLKAFQKVQPNEKDLDFSKHFVRYAKGLPLALTVFGSLLSQTRRDAWDGVLANLQKYPNSNVFESLKISYDGLQEEARKIFLDIACFHKGKAKEQVIDILDRRFNISSKSVIDTLIVRSLLTMSNANYLGMHDLIQDMGRAIVRRESDDAGKRTRIWCFNDLDDVLIANTGTEVIQAIVVNSPELEEIRCDSNGFSNMRGLRHLELHNVKIVSSAPIWPQLFLCIIHWKLYPWDPICLPPSLRIISWDFFPFEFLPRSFLTHNLTELRMPQSKLVWFWDGRMDFPNLKIMDLQGSTELINTPNFTGMPNLEQLQCFACLNLVDIHSSIAVHKRLKVLNFFGCESIKSLPSKLEMDSLERLDLGICSKLKEVPEFSEKMTTLSHLRIFESAIEQLPSSIGNLVGLTELTLWNTAIEQLPSSIENLVNLTHLNLSKSAIKQLPSSIGNLVGLTHLKLGGCKMLCMAGWPLNQALNRLRCLEELDLSNYNLGEGAIPEDIDCLSSLRRLGLGENHFVTLPASIQRLSMLGSLRLDRCEMLQELPPLPSKSHGDLYVSVQNCTSLQRLTDPSKLTSNDAKLYDFDLNPLNCAILVEDESFINYVCFKIFRWITHNEPVPFHLAYRFRFTYPASEIPEWFVNKSEEAGDWLGIAFCFVWASEIPHGHMLVGIEWSSGIFDPLVEGLIGRPKHVTMFHRSRKECRKECPEPAEAELSFKTEARFGTASKSMKEGVNIVKKWAARLVYKQDLVDLQQRLKVLKPTHDYYGEDVGPSGSDAISDD